LLAGSAGVPTGNILTCPRLSCPRFRIRLLVARSAAPRAFVNAVAASSMTPAPPMTPMTPIIPIQESIDKIIDSRKKQAHDFPCSSLILHLDEPVKLATIDR
jgi:hypothetical protein